MTITREFILAGRALFTLEVPGSWTAANPDCQPHYTFKVKGKELDDGSGKMIYFVSLLAGPNNDADYAYLGVLNAETGEVKLTKASKMGQDCWPVKLIQRVAARIWAGEQEAIEAAGFKLHHEGRCCRCGRMLTVPSSIESGIGPECATKMAGC